MKVLVTGSSGHLGEALVRTLERTAHQVAGLDLVPSPYTTHVGSIVDRAFVKECMAGVDAVLHAATLHKPHVATEPRRDFVDTNVTGTLHLLEEAAAVGAGAFIFTSTTSAFGRALTPPPGAPAVWVTEDLRSLPRNIYGVTKAAAEDLCELFYRLHGFACVILRTSRFFPEPDDESAVRQAYEDGNVKANEYLYRRVDIQDVVDAHLLALDKAASIGFGRYIVSATTPFGPGDLTELRGGAAGLVSRLVPEYGPEYARRGWRMFPAIDRVYVNARARQELGWRPQYDFRRVIERLQAGEDPRSPLARTVGFKGYDRGGREAASAGDADR